MGYGEGRGVLTEVVKLFPGDKAAETLTMAILELLYDRGDGMPIPTILGVLEIVKDVVKASAYDE